MWFVCLLQATLLTFVGPKASKNLNDDEFFAVFTVGIFVIGTAVCNIPSGPIFHKYGRHGGFLVGTLMLLLGGAVGASSIAAESLGLLFLGSFILGIGVGFGQFYRFAAIEMANEENKGWAVTTVLMGGCVAAFFGPTLGLLSKDMFNAEYAGSFFMMIVLAILNLITISFIRFPNESALSKQHKQHTVSSHTTNPVNAVNVGESVTTLSDHSASDIVVSNYSEIFVSRTFVNSTLISAIAQIIMLILMISSILKMNDLDFTLVQQALVLDFHFFAMFGTGFVTNYILKMYGIYNAIIIAWVLIGTAVAFFLGSHELYAFFIGDFLIGVGWNILFSTGTVMLSFCYKPHERHTVQSVFEIIINSISGAFSIVSGFILSAYGWDHVVYGILGIFAALTVTAPIYARFYADPSANFREKRESTVEVPTLSLTSHDGIEEGVR